MLFVSLLIKKLLFIKIIQILKLKKIKAKKSF